jgi:hypothetical protein
MNNTILILIFILILTVAFKIESANNNIMPEYNNVEFISIYHNCLMKHTIVNDVIDNDCKKIARYTYNKQLIK